jgi:glycerol-3-phosphate dehydrogenase (NAD(P)+)
MSRIIVIGAGSWGAAIAAALVRAGQDVTVLSRRQDHIDALAAGRCLRLPDCAPIMPIPATLDAGCLVDATQIFVAVPVAANTENFARIAARQTGAVRGTVVLCAKGITTADDGTASLLTDIAGKMLPDHPLAVFSGPSFADEVFAGLPAALVAASHDLTVANQVQSVFEGSNLRVYSNDDPIGVALAGAMKNVIAIAAGCAVGAGYGDNAKAAILTRGLAEITRFAAIMGAKTDTVFGLAGVGDLALTCAGPHSRNMAFGMALGRGEAPSSSLAEGSRTVGQLARLAQTKGVDLPLTNAVDKLVNHGQDLHVIVADLLARRAGSE